MNEQGSELRTGHDIHIGDRPLELVLSQADYVLEASMSEMLAIYFAHRTRAYERLCVLVENARAGVAP